MPFLPAPKLYKNELINILETDFGLGKLLTIKKLEKGYANSLYRIKTTKGEFVFKIAIRNSQHRVRYEIDLLNFLSGLPIPRPLKNKSGKYLFDYHGFKAFVYPFLPGKQAHRFSDEMLHEVGAFLGKLHVQTIRFRSPVRRERFYTISSQKIQRVGRRSKHLGQNITSAMAYIKSKALSHRLSVRLPKGAMHIDVKPENVLFLNGRLTGVVDFDNSYIGPLVYDLADTLMWFCSAHGKFNFRKAKIICKGYERFRKLNSLERKLLPMALHHVHLAVSLCCVDYLIQKKLPEHFVIWILNNFLETQKRTNFSLLGV